MNDYDEEDAETLFINLNLEARLVRCAGSTLIPSKFSLRADLDPAEDASEADLSLAISKIRYFFEHVVSKTIAFSADNGDVMAMLVNEEGRNRTGNLLMTTPGEPNDEMFATLFQAKMRALANGVIDFTFVEIKSDNLVGLSFCFVGDGRKVLPGMKDWIGERTYFDKPWWERNDASTLDVVPPEGADLSVKPGWAYTIDPVGGPKQESNLVVRPSFKPTVIVTGDAPETDKD